MKKLRPSPLCLKSDENKTTRVQGCEIYDAMEMENVFYCEDGCSPGCISTGSADRDSETDYEECQNIASRMVQKEALAHAQVRVCVCIDCLSCLALQQYHSTYRPRVAVDRRQDASLV